MRRCIGKWLFSGVLLTVLCFLAAPAARADVIIEEGVGGQPADFSSDTYLNTGTDIGTLTTTTQIVGVMDNNDDSLDIVTFTVPTGLTITDIILSGTNSATPGILQADVYFTGSGPLRDTGTVNNTNSSIFSALSFSSPITAGTYLLAVQNASLGSATMDYTLTLVAPNPATGLLLVCGLLAVLPFGRGRRRAH